MAPPGSFSHFSDFCPNVYHIFWTIIDIFYHILSSYSSFFYQNFSIIYFLVFFVFLAICSIKLHTKNKSLSSWASSIFYIFFVPTNFMHCNDSSVQNAIWCVFIFFVKIVFFSFYFSVIFKLSILLYVLKKWSSKAKVRIITSRTIISSAISWIIATCTNTIPSTQRTRIA